MATEAFPEAEDSAQAAAHLVVADLAEVPRDPPVRGAEAAWAVADLVAADAVVVVLAEEEDAAAVVAAVEAAVVDVNDQCPRKTK